MRSCEWVVFWFAFVRCRIVSRVQLRCVTSANASVNCATADAQVGHQRKSLTWRHTTNTDRRPHRRRPSTAVRQQPQQQKQQQHYIKYMRRIRKKQLKNLRDKKTWNEWEFDWGRPTTATAACNEAYHLDMNTHSTDTHTNRQFNEWTVLRIARGYWHFIEAGRMRLARSAIRQFRKWEWEKKISVN